MTPSIHHVGLAVRDVDAAAAYYARYYGLEVEQEHVSKADGVRELMLGISGSYLQLLEPTRDDSPVAHFLERRGPGIHHLALAVADASATLERIKAGGERVVDTQPRPGTGGHEIAFIHPQGAMGALTELVQTGVGTAR